MNIVCEMKFGKVLFDTDQNAFYHIHNGETKVLNDNKIIHCEVCDPRKKIVEIPVLKIPVYTSEDYKEITLNQLVRGILKETFENNKDFISFENIAFGINKCTPFEFVQ